MSSEIHFDVNLKKIFHIFEDNDASVPAGQFTMDYNKSPSY